MAKITAAPPKRPLSRLSCYRVEKPTVLPSHVRTRTFGARWEKEAEGGRKEEKIYFN